MWRWCTAAACGRWATMLNPFLCQVAVRGSAASVRLCGSAVCGLRDASGT